MTLASGSSTQFVQLPQSAPHRDAAARCSCAVLAQAALGMVDQCEALVHLLDDRGYAMDSKVMAGGTVGKHLRHVLDHYAAVLGDEGQAEGGLSGAGVIDYDHRARNVPMETQRSAALEALSRIRGQLERVASVPATRAARVRVMVGGDGAEMELDTTLGRELAFATHHAVHHQAMMRAIATEQGVTLPADFGKAPSTVHYEHKTQAAG